MRPHVLFGRGHCGRRRWQPRHDAHSRTWPGPGQSGTRGAAAGVRRLHCGNDAPRQGVLGPRRLCVPALQRSLLGARCLGHGGLDLVAQTF